MASTSHSQRPHEYLDALLATLPHESIPQDIVTTSQGVGHSSSPYPKFIDTALRLVSGGSARADEAPHLRDAWSDIQASVQRTLNALHRPTSSQPPTKRKHSPSSPVANQKKPKYDRREENGQAGDAVDEDDADDAPHLTLHALSVTAPVRHKVDITLHARTLRLAHSTTGAPTARCARTVLTRAFLLPTRARSSGALQCTALLLAGDKPAPPTPKGARAASGTGAVNAAGTARFELACSVPDSPNAAVPRMTVHSAPSASAPPSQPVSAREALLALISSIVSGTSVTLTTAERAAPLTGVTAFRGVRETSLWFFDGAGAGILADARPAEFWAVEDLARGEAGVRLRTATGRTCSVVLTRRNARGNDEKRGEDAMSEDEEEEGEETEFQMIDGKEREGISEWVRRHRDAFGIATVQRGAQAVQGAGAVVAEAKDGEGTGARGDSDSDSDFEVSSASSDGGSPTGGSNSSSSSSSDAGSGVGEDDGSEHGSQEQESDSDGDEDVVELEPKHHPLLRTGALPKMSRAAMDAAVGLVVGDLVGQVGRGPPGPGKAGPGRPVAQNENERDGHDGGDDDEEDELDD